MQKGHGFHKGKFKDFIYPVLGFGGTPGREELTVS
jgi:hypothetical protein